MISKKTLLKLANKWEPAASQSEPGFRKATCVQCGEEMVEMWHCWLDDGGFKKEIHLCESCAIHYGMFARLKTLIVISTNNGKKYLQKLLPTLKYPYIVIDTGSTEKDSIEYFDALECRKAKIKGGYCVAAYEYGYRSIKSEEYFFMHDSMIVKEPYFIEDFRAKGDVVAWLRFYYAPEHGIDYLKTFPGASETDPEWAIFGPIFYAKYEVMKRLDDDDMFPPHPVSKDQAVASESGYGLIFHRINQKVEYMEDMCNQRLDETKDYKYFDKFRPHRI